MRKKLFLLAAALFLTLTASAQFEEEKVYVGGSLTGLDLNYNGNNGFSFGVQARGGYFLEDNWLVLGQVAFEHSGHKTVPDYISVGAGLRYYIVQNGLFLGANCNFVHAYHNYNDLMPGLEIGYAFFISKTVTIEPSVYYNQSFKNHADFSTVGLKLGVGIYI
ncbi:outer membrane beta-barrel protein [Prevotella sp. oral taxon 475]|jgi:hypothetical protein|uniref:outer membrane beta-barrel protein n=1 Tax=Prevotella sp. oral taxon 475 TaxID=712471 RepID=UPI001BAACF32|nr:outer membrane beta-barrel protein [Prevotella sp. oral taxon 475]QUB46381.1 outer membrane beta-barrel protein [Prevotella sp. oral taxon 475]